MPIRRGAGETRSGPEPGRRLQEQVRAGLRGHPRGKRGAENSFLHKFTQIRDWQFVQDNPLPVGKPL